MITYLSVLSPSLSVGNLSSFFFIFFANSLEAVSNSLTLQKHVIALKNDNIYVERNRLIS